jgi:hypothetical protein
MLQESLLSESARYPVAHRVVRRGIAGGAWTPRMTKAVPD